MRTWQAALGFGAAFLAGNAFAQTANTYVKTEAGSLAPFTFLPWQYTLLPAQSPISQMESLGQMQSLGRSYGSTYGVDFGNGFKTQIEGLTVQVDAPRFGGVAASQNVTTTRLLLKGLYEFSDGNWTVRPYLSAGFGAADVSGQILGISSNDWAMAYQLSGGVALGFTEKLMGNLEYRWTDGSRATFSLAGVPNTVGFEDRSVLLGVNYKY